MKRILTILAALLVLFSCTKEGTGTLFDGEDWSPIESLELQEDASGYRFYTFRYTTVDINGDDVVLSAAMIVPKSSKIGATIPRVILANHVTIFDKRESPSLYMLTKKSNEASAMVKKGGALCIMPDYEGYGVSENRPHPYIVRSLSGRQCADALLKGMEMFRKLEARRIVNPLDTDYKTYCMGYSQGAAVSLSVQQYLEENNLAESVHFAGTVCGGLPSDLVETVSFYLRESGETFGIQTDHVKDRISPPVTMPFFVKCYCECLPEMKQYSPSDYFSKIFLDSGLLELMAERTHTTSALQKLLSARCKDGFTAPDGTVYSKEEALKLYPVMETSRVEADLKWMLTPECYSYLSERDLYKDPGEESGPMPALHRALLKNSFLGDWTPSHPIKILHSKGDCLIPYGNALSFMEKHSGGAPIAIETAFSGTDHTTAGSLFYVRMMLSSNDFDTL